MSKKQQEAPEAAGIDNLNDSLTQLTTKVQNNGKLIAICSVVIVAIVAVVLSYLYFFRTPAIQKANDNIGSADLALALGNDSIALAQYSQLADNGSYDAGNRASLQAAIMLYGQGKYEEALGYASKYSAKDDIIGAGAKSLEGDCLVNLDRLDEAVSAYKKAIKISDKNPAYTPFFMLKLARVYAAQGNHADEAATYQEVATYYPLYCQDHQIDIEKYLERAKLQAAK